MAEISFHLADDVEHPFPTQEADFTSWLINVGKSESKRISSLTYIFCSDDYLLDLNIKYLGHDYYTDIITFPYKEGDEVESDLWPDFSFLSVGAFTFLSSYKGLVFFGILFILLQQWIDRKFVRKSTEVRHG